jgi:hypothetical protein
MAKNPRRAEQQAVLAKSSTTAARSGPLISKRGKKVIGIGVLGVVLGFWILTYTDPAGQNWASTLSPALLVLGYALIGVGIVLPDPAAPLPTATSPQN